MKKSAGHLAAAVLVVLALAAGCAREQEEAEKPGEEEREWTEAPQPSPEQARTDDEIAEELRNKLEADNQLSNYNITIVVKDKQTSITGAVPNRNMKDKLDLLASTVAGQEQIMNEVTITYSYAPPVGPRSDSEIKDEMRTKMEIDSELSQIPLNLEVVERTIMLTGVVPSEYIKAKAGDLARTIAGAERVENELLVKRLATTKAAEE